MGDRKERRKLTALGFRTFKAEAMLTGKLETVVVQTYF